MKLPVIANQYVKSETQSQPLKCRKASPRVHPSYRYWVLAYNGVEPIILQTHSFLFIFYLLNLLQVSVPFPVHSVNSLTTPESAFMSRTHVHACSQYLSPQRIRLLMSSVMKRSCRDWSMLRSYLRLYVGLARCKSTTPFNI